MATAGHPFGEGDRGRQSGGILVDVERAVEVGDPQALQFELVVDDEPGSEIGIEQSPVETADVLERQRLAGFGRSVCQPLELGEHRLPDNRGPDAVDLPGEDRRPLARGSRPRQERPGEELLVERARYLGDEDRVAGELVGLGLRREPRVHRMPRLVGEREHVLDPLLLEVHEDVGIGIIGAGAEGPGLLAGVRVAVAPPPP